MQLQSYTTMTPLFDGPSGSLADTFSRRYHQCSASVLLVI